MVTLVGQAKRSHWKIINLNLNLNLNLKTSSSYTLELSLELASVGNGGQVNSCEYEITIRIIKLHISDQVLG